MADTDRIAETFNGKTAFVTGGSGFLGKVLIEKLLRCTDIRKIYVLIRRKKGMSSNERINSIFKNPLYDLLREQKPDSFKKCVAIAGDVSEIELGMSEYYRDILINETNFIFHAAATTRFDDTLKYAVLMNTRGTQFVLDLAKKCKNLKLFIHVSTAYAFPQEKILYETPYQPPAKPDNVLNSLTWLKEDSGGRLTKELLGETPNSYTFSKALAEDLVNDEVGKLPVIIVRPAIVVPIYDSPLKGWCNNLQGPMGLFVGAGKGVIRSMYLNPNAKANLIPADVTINLMMIACMEYLNNNGVNHIYNACVPVEDFQKNWHEIIEEGKQIIFNKIPFNMILWYPGGGITYNKFLHNVNFYLFQLIPAILVDILLFILGFKPILYQIQRRIQKGGEMFEFYTTKDWNFSTDSVHRLRKMLNKTEQQIYRMDSDGFNMQDYLGNCIMSIRRINLKETDDMLPRAKTTMKVMYVVDKVCKILFFVGVFYYLYKMFCLVY